MLNFQLSGMSTTRHPKTWRDFPALLPLKCNRHQIVAQQNHLFITGGENSEENKISDAIYEISITPPHSVQIVCHMPEPRVGHGAELHDNKVTLQHEIKLDKKKQYLSRQNYGDHEWAIRIIG